MENEEQKRVEEAVQEEKEELEEATLQLRRSKLQKENYPNGTIAKADGTNEVSSNGHTESNEENGTSNGSMVVGNEEPHGPVEPILLPDYNGEADKTPEAKDVEHGSENSVYYDKDKGGDFISVFSEEEPSPALETLDDTSHKKISSKKPLSAENFHSEGHLKDAGSSASTLPPSEIIDEDHSANHKASNLNEIESADVDLIDESDLDVEGIDLAKVLQKQNTHDLYCPNCNSCITRRVILRKRKRRIRNLGEDIKRNKLEAEVEPEKGSSSLQPTSDQVRDTLNAYDDSRTVPAADDHYREGEPEVFRCLACFSFFIPTGSGFKLFRTFGRTGAKPTAQDEQASESNRNWFSSIFAPNKGKTPSEKGSAGKIDMEKNDKGAHTQSSNANNENGQSSKVTEAVSSVHITEGLLDVGTVKPREAALNGNVTINIRDINNTIQSGQENDLIYDSGVDNGKQWKEERTFSYPRSDEAVTVAAGRAPVKSGESEVHAVSATHQDGLKFLITSDLRPPILDRSQADQIVDIETLKITQDEEANRFVSNSKLHISVNVPDEYEQPTGTMLVTNSVVEDTNAKFKVAENGGIYLDQVSTSITKTEVKSQVAANVASGKDTIIQLEAGLVENTASQMSENAIDLAQGRTSQLGTQVNVVQQTGIEAGDSYGIEIIKSIIYGGLVESITSLSVVSSAAGGGAATLNTLALGMANLIGGIFVIGHNLWQLKNDQEDQAISQMTERTDKYRELLGRRKNFVLHAVVAILSYLIFGLLPPIIYGFSFRKTDDRELKLVVVAAASFVCILALSIGKAYVQRPPKAYVGTVLRYIVLGFMVSGVSYVAGELFNRFLEKLGLFESGSNPSMFLHDMTSKKEGWASF